MYIKNRITTQSNFEYEFFQYKYLLYSGKKYHAFKNFKITIELHIYKFILSCPTTIKK